VKILKEIIFENGSKIHLTTPSTSIRGKGYHFGVDSNRQQMNLCNGTGQIGYAVDIDDYCPCPGCEACESDNWKPGENADE
jgi:hypothetical protein